MCFRSCTALLRGALIGPQWVQYNPKDRSQTWQLVGKIEDSKSDVSIQEYKAVLRNNG